MNCTKCHLPIATYTGYLERQNENKEPHKQLADTINPEYIRVLVFQCGCSIMVNVGEEKTLIKKEISVTADPETETERLFKFELEKMRERTEKEEQTIEYRQKQRLIQMKLAEPILIMTEEVAKDYKQKPIMKEVK